MNHESGESRPKIYRLPQLSANTKEPPVSRMIVVLCFALLAVAAIPALWSYLHHGKERTVETVSADISPSVAPVQQVAPASIAIRDENGRIVGQMAPMPADAEPGISVNTTAKVDQKSGKELLNIISKY